MRGSVGRYIHTIKSRAKAVRSWYFSTFCLGLGTIYYVLQWDLVVLARLGFLFNGYQMIYSLLVSLRKGGGCVDCRYYASRGIFDMRLHIQSRVCRFIRSIYIYPVAIYLVSGVYQRSSQTVEAKAQVTSNYFSKQDRKRVALSTVYLHFYLLKRETNNRMN
ncbi:hypothetical protein BJX62DRAFT_145280 [Aspergillus germanicus]